jgi:hypothetical protein
MIFVIILVAIVTVGRLVRMGMEMEAHKQGFSFKDRRGRLGLIADRNPADAAIVADNERLRSNVARLEARMAVLERIATDTPNRLSAEIEKLRD